jgi:hypothetical protein
MTRATSLAMRAEASAPRLGASNELIRATARLEREGRSGRCGYDDIAVPGWDAFVYSRLRYLAAQRPPGRNWAAGAPSDPIRREGR